MAMRDVIQKVIAAEGEAKLIVKAAWKESDRILADARTQAHELMDQARKEAKLEAERILEAAEQEADQEKQERLMQAAAKIQTQIRLEEPIMQRAVGIVVRCVCSSR
jgi:vacuolar-type H+-ATPase subunit H